jgi:hypothetical protein
MTMRLTAVRPEPVEGLPFDSASRGVTERGFDKLSPNGVWL